MQETCSGHGFANFMVGTPGRVSLARRTQASYRRAAAGDARGGANPRGRRPGSVHSARRQAGRAARAPPCGSGTAGAGAGASAPGREAPRGPLAPGFLPPRKPASEGRGSRAARDSAPRGSGCPAPDRVSVRRGAPRGAGRRATGREAQGAGLGARGGRAGDRGARALPSAPRAAAAVPRGSGSSTIVSGSSGGGRGRGGSARLAPPPPPVPSRRGCGGEARGGAELRAGRAAGAAPSLAARTRAAASAGTSSGFRASRPDLSRFSATWQPARPPPRGKSMEQSVATSPWSVVETTAPGWGPQGAGAEGDGGMGEGDGDAWVGFSLKSVELKQQRH